MKLGKAVERRRPRVISREIARMAENTIFGCKFIKRTTGEERHMVARLHVRKGVTGKGMAYNAADYDLLTVFDMQKAAFRSIPLDAITELTVRGQTFTCEDDYCAMCGAVVEYATDGRNELCAACREKVRS